MPSPVDIKIQEKYVTGHRWKSRRFGRLIRNARGAAYVELSILILLVALTASTAVAGLGLSINTMYCGAVYGMDGRRPEDGKESYTSDPEYGRHCWRVPSIALTSSSPALYYF